MGGWVKLHRSLLEWEWYDDIITKTLFVHLLLTSNFKPTKWRGVDLDVGERVVSRAGLAEETGLSERKIRTSQNRLKTSHETTSRTTNGYTVIKLVNYRKYQGETSEDVTEETPSERPGSDHGIRSKEVKEVKELKNKSLKPFGDKPVKYSDSFQRFWEVYPINKGKFTAYKSWLKINPDEELENKIIQGLKNSIVRDRCFRDSNFTPYGATWLNNRRWEDEFTDDKPYRQKKEQSTEEILNQMIASEGEIQEGDVFDI